MRNIDLLRVDKISVPQIPNGEFEVSIGLHRRQEEHVVVLERLKDVLQISGLVHLDCLAVYYQNFVLVELRRKQCLKGLEPHLAWKLDRGVPGDRAKRLTTALEQRRAEVAESRPTASLLPCWLSARPPHISFRLHPPRHFSPVFLPVDMSAMHNVPPQRLVPNLVIEAHGLSCEVSSDKLENRNRHFGLLLKRKRRPGPLHDLLFRRLLNRPWQLLGLDKRRNSPPVRPRKHG